MPCLWHHLCRPCRQHPQPQQAQQPQSSPWLAHARSPAACAAVKHGGRRLIREAGVGQRRVSAPLVVSLQPDGSDVWRLEPVIQILRDGGVSARQGLLAPPRVHGWCPAVGHHVRRLPPPPPPHIHTYTHPAPHPPTHTHTVYLHTHTHARTHTHTHTHTQHQTQLGIIPTDSLPAVVCDLGHRTAPLRLYDAMELAPKKQLSILVGGFADIALYTTGVRLVCGGVCVCVCVCVSHTHTVCVCVCVSHTHIRYVCCALRNTR
jgi:hypothetical protein